MSNTIDQSLSGGNSMKPLSFTWKAFFLDGSILEQFEKGTEHKFQEVKDKFDKLIRFSLVNKDYSQCFTVDLQNGFIIYNNPLLTNNREKKDNVRLIFFRRHTVEMTEKVIEKSHSIEYHLGCQWNDKLGNNRQTVLIIDNEGNWVILGE